MNINLEPEKKSHGSIKWLEDGFEKLNALAEKTLETDDDLPLSKHLLLFGIAAFFLIAIIWASFATLDERTRGEGKFIPSSQTQVLQSLEGGIVDKILVREGDKVKKGQLLAQLNDIGATSDLGENRAKYYGLLATVARLKAEAEGASSPAFSDEVMKNAPDSVQDEMNAFRANQLNIENQISVFSSQSGQKSQEVREITERISDTERVLSLAREKKASIEPLVARGSAPKLELLDLESEIARQETELNSLRSSLPRARGGVGEISARIADVKSRAKADAQVKLAQIMIDVNAIQQGMGSLQDRKSRTEIKSPVDGIVKSIKVTTVGGVVKAGEAFMDIVPIDDQLMVEARIRPADIAFIRPGQEAMVKISAYDFSIYGGLKAKVVDISADTIANEKGENFYRVRLRTDQTVLKHKGQELPIIPGMVANVDVLTGKKTIMEYLLKPFIKTLSDSMHER